jgi:hypothetical protein
MAMLRGARHPAGPNTFRGTNGGDRKSIIGRSRAGSNKSRVTTASWASHHLGALLGVQQQSDSCASCALVLVAFCIATAAFYAAIRRHDVELSFDQLSAFERHVHTFGNRTVYVVDPSHPDPVLSTLPHEDWTKISYKIDYVAFLYNDLYMFTNMTPDAFVHTAASALEELKPHCYGIALFSCGCLIHNVLFQHTSTRFDGMECAMLPGFVFEQDAIRWVHIPESAAGCPARDQLYAGKQPPWYTVHSWKLDTARAEYAAVLQHLAQTEHADRPEPQRKQIDGS